MRAVISTNGTLITREMARIFKDIGLSYVGISLDGMKEINDRFRGVPGAFEQALEGIRNCREAGIKVGLRFTINKRNADQVGPIFDLLRRGKHPPGLLLPPGLRRPRLPAHGRRPGSRRDPAGGGPDHRPDERTFDQGLEKEVLTVDNHADGPYLYLRLLKEGSARAPEVLELLQMNGGNSSGRGIGCVSWDGQVHADQFWRHYSFGNVRQRPFSEIWQDISNPLMARLKEKKKYVTGRCAKCRWLDICGGNFRVRAEAATGDLWAPDPACYLTDEEIGASA